QNLDKIIRQQVEEFFGPSLVLESIIHRYVGVAEATAMKKSVVESSTTSSATFDFMKLLANSIRKSTMNKRNREQLRASVANDLVQGKRNSSATTDLLKQYTPLEGILTPQVADTPASAAPVEKSLAPHATVVPGRSPAWHDANVAAPASVAADATVEQYAEVKGEL